MASPRLKILDSPLANHFSAVMQSSHTLNLRFLPSPPAAETELIFLQADGFDHIFNMQIFE
jgi:hypothetical protein